MFLPKLHHFIGLFFNIKPILVITRNHLLPDCFDFRCLSLFSDEYLTYASMYKNYRMTDL